MLPLFYGNILDILKKEKQEKYKTFIPERQQTIEDIQNWLNENEEFTNQFNSWLETGYCDEIKKLYEDLMKSRLVKNIGFIRRNVLYLYLVEKLKDRYSEKDLDWIEKELFTICLYDKYQNLYLSFMIWRIKAILYSLYQGKDIRSYIKENWMDVQYEFNQAKTKFLKLVKLKPHYHGNEFFWLHAELFLLDIIFETETCFTVLEKCLLAYQLYRNYHSVEYHLKCGDSIYKLLFLIHYNVPNEILIQLYEMILVCYNKYVQEGEEFIHKPLSFTFHLSEGKVSLNLQTYNHVCELLFSLTKDYKYLTMKK